MEINFDAFEYLSYPSDHIDHDMDYQNLYESCESNDGVPKYELDVAECLLALSLFSSAAKVDKLVLNFHQEQSDRKTFGEHVLGSSDCHRNKNLA